MIVNNFLSNSWMTFQFWYYIAEECTILWGINLVGIARVSFSVIMHSCPKSVPYFRHISAVMYKSKTGIEFALSV